MGEAVERWGKALDQRYPDLVGHLVWDGEALERLNAAATEVILADPAVARDLVPVYRRGLVNRVTGLGPLNDLLLDETVSDIMINGPDRVFVDRGGRIERVDLTFGDDREVLMLAQRLAARAGRTLTSEQPVCDAELADGSRIQAVIPPVAERAAITIRRRRQQALTVEECLRRGMFSEELWRDLVDMVTNRLNIVVAGGAGTGKTSLLRLLADRIADTERIVVIEEVRELRLAHPNAVSLVALPFASAERLFAHALRMRPDRILVGEVRGPEVLALLEAMSSGHPGSLSTVHSPSGGMETVHRLARLGLRAAGGIGFAELIDQIRRTVEVVVYLYRYPDGTRRVLEVNRIGPGAIQKVWAYDPEAGQFRRGDTGW